MKEYDIDQLLEKFTDQTTECLEFLEKRVGLGYVHKQNNQTSEFIKADLKKQKRKQKIMKSSVKNEYNQEKQDSMTKREFLLKRYKRK